MVRAQRLWGWSSEQLEDSCPGSEATGSGSVLVPAN